MKNEVLFVEPFMRGSRSQSLISAVSNFNGTFKILTRRDWHNCAIASKYINPINVIAIDIFSNDTWLRRLSKVELKKLIKHIYYDGACFERVVFMSIDEYFYRFHFLKFLIKSNRRVVKCIWYRPPVSITMKYFIGLFIMNFSQLYVFGNTKLRACLLVDPWFDTGREYQAKEKKNTMFVLGRQTPRKGLNTVLKALEEVREIRNYEFWIIGATSEADKFLIDDLISKGFNIKHVVRYFEEDDLNVFLLDKGVMLLPYTKDFITTSGNLIRAAFLKIPVIGPSHGLLMQKIMHYGTGRIFKSEDPYELAKVIDEMNVSDWSNYYDGMSRFQRDNSPEVFAEKLLNK